MAKNRYPVYVLSKGRFQNCSTAKFLLRDKVDFYLVVEAQEYEDYKANLPDANILVLPPESTGRGAIPVRNWIWEHSKSNGFRRHWELDDNILELYRMYKKKRIRCDSLPVLAACEDFTDRYTNIAISGLNYYMFGFPCGKGRPPFYLNCHVYSCMLIDNNLEQRWRGTYNADTDLCLQVLAAGLCTVQFNVFMADKRQTMTQSGGNTENYKGDGRLKMARSLERVWPQVAVVGRRYNRPQHVIRYNWTRFDTPLKRDPSIDWSQFTSDNEYGMSLQAVGEIRSERLKKLIADNDS